MKEGSFNFISQEKEELMRCKRNAYDRRREEKRKKLDVIEKLSIREIQRRDMKKSFGRLVNDRRWLRRDDNRLDVED